MLYTKNIGDILFINNQLNTVNKHIFHCVHSIRLSRNKIHKFAVKKGFFRPKNAFTENLKVKHVKRRESNL